MGSPEPTLITPLAVRHRVLLLVVIGSLLYVPFLGLRDFWYPDEPDIGEVCQAMYVSGDWVAPRRVGEIWVDYPPMLYWAGAISAHALGGVSEFALRLTNAIAAIILVVLTCVAVSRWLGPRSGLWAGFMLLSFQQFVAQAVEYRPDMLFALFITAGFFAYAGGCEARGRWWLRALAFAFFGLAMLAKGPLGLLLPGLVLTLWHGSNREWRRLLGLAPLAVISLAVYLPWFVACAGRMGADNILYELYAQNFARFVAGARGHANPFYYYVAYFWGDLFPWSFLAPFALAWWVKTGRWRDRNAQLALWWFGTFLIFLSIAVTKRQVYLLPVYPAVALLLAPWVDSVGRGGEDAPSPKPVRGLAVLVVTLFSVLAAVAFTAVFANDFVVEKARLDAAEIAVAHGLRGPLAALGVLLVAGAVWITAAWRGKRAGAILARIGIAAIVVYAALYGLVVPTLNPIKTYKPQSEWIRDFIGDETNFGIYHPQNDLGIRKKGAFAYYSGRLVTVLDEPEQVTEFFSEHPSSIVLVEEKAAAGLFADDESAWRERVVRELRASRWTYLVVGPPVVEKDLFQAGGAVPPSF
jgi:4-amino-4-deoxy-L-arabinose transferase-like glycosyltransferase